MLLAKEKKYFTEFKNKFFNFEGLLKITNITIDKKLIKCSYAFAFATRIHHLSTKETFLLPKTIINSFAFNYFSKEEQNLILICNTYNDIILFYDNSKHYISTIYNGTQMLVTIRYKNEKQQNLIKLLFNLLEFTNFCRKYKTPTETEKIITMIIEKK